MKNEIYFNFHQSKLIFYFFKKLKCCFCKSNTNVRKMYFLTTKEVTKLKIFKYKYALLDKNDTPTEGNIICFPFCSKACAVSLRLNKFFIEEFYEYFVDNIGHIHSYEELLLYNKKQYHFTYNKGEWTMEYIRKTLSPLTLVVSILIEMPRFDEFPNPISSFLSISNVFAPHECNEKIIIEFNTKDIKFLL